ncbi:MAG: hypothetical protein H7841_05035 [Magnetospirillum sp. WYHS-4]
MPFLLTIEAPPLPLGPRIVTVDKSDFKGSVTQRHDFRLHMAVPLAPGHRWEIKEAVQNTGGTTSEKWEPFDLKPLPGEAGVFGGSAGGYPIRIVFVEKSDGWQLFPETVTVLLSIELIPLC